MPKQVHKFLVRLEPTVWLLLQRRAKRKKWSLNRTINEAIKDVTDE